MEFRKEKIKAAGKYVFAGSFFMPENYTSRVSIFLIGVINLRRYDKGICFITILFLIFGIYSPHFVKARQVKNIDFKAESSDSSSQFKKIGIIGGTVLLGVFLISEYFSQKRKEEKFEGHVNKGKKALKEKEYETAINNFEKALEIEGDEEVKNLLKKAENEYRAYHYQKGKQYLEEENWKKALEELKKVAESKNNYKDVNQLKEEVVTGYQEKHYNTGIKYLNSEEWIKAYEEFVKVEDYGKFKESSKLKEKAIRGYQEFNYQKGKEYINKEEWEKAYNSLTRVEEYGDYKNTSELKKKAVKGYQDILYQEAVKLFNNNRYKKAYVKFKQVNKFGVYKKSLELERKSYQAIHYQKGNNYLNEGNWEKAYEEYNKVHRYGKYKNSSEKTIKAYNKIKEERTTRLSILEFDSIEDSYGIEKTIPDLFVHKLLSRKIETIKVLERKQLRAILKEQNLKTSGLIDSDEASEIAKLPGVDILVTGTIQNIDLDYDKTTEENYIDEEDEEKTYTYKQFKTVTTRIIYKLVNAENGEIISSNTLSRDADWSYSSKSGYTSKIPSDKKLIEKTVEKLTAELVQRIVDKFAKDLPEAPDEL